MERSEDENQLDYIIGLSDTHRASDPRDKIFALESLLPKCIGRLLHIDYNEPCEDVFKRVTARLYNSRGSLRMATVFHFLIESHSDTTGPSWVLDFTNSDMRFRQSQKSHMVAKPVTLDGFIYESTRSNPMKVERLLDGRCFATPSTIFCPGVRIDYIFKAEAIKGLDPDNENGGLATLILDIERERRSRQGLDEQLHTLDADTTAKLVQPYIFFFALQSDKEVPIGYENLGVLVRSRFDALIGRYYFITEGGIVGLAASPVQKGDSLSLSYNTPMYFILREVQGQNLGSNGTQEHRIVSRAAVNNDLIDMVALIKTRPRQQFQIV